MPTKEFENKAFAKNTQQVVEHNLVNQATPFNSVFNTKALQTNEAETIAKLLIDHVEPGNFDEQNLAKDILQLQRFTSEIHAIGKQGALLMGERLHQARILLMKYKHGAFTKWLSRSVGSPKTAYNILAYYHLYQNLPSEDLRDKLKQIAQNTAYILASRGGDMELKANLINQNYNLPDQEFLSVIKEKLPVARQMKTNPNRLISRHTTIIGLLKDAIQNICLHYQDLSDDHKRDVGLLVVRLRATTNM